MTPVCVLSYHRRSVAYLSARMAILRTISSMIDSSAVARFIVSSCTLVDEREEG